MYKVLHVNFYDSGGGAAQVSKELAFHFNHHVICGKKISDGNWSTEIPKKGFWNYIFSFTDKVFNFILPDTIFFRKIYSLFPQKISTALYNRPIRIRDLLFYHSARYHSYSNIKNLDIYKESDIIHFHNLHGGYFDLFAIRNFLMDKKKIIWTLHDMWLLTGGEAHTFGDENFLYGNPYTPYDNTYPFPAIRFVDRRKSLMNYKKELLELINGDGVLVCCSFWLEGLLRRSYMSYPNLKIVTIHSGIQTSVFNNKNKRNWKKVRVGFFDSGSPFKNSQQFYRTMKSILKRTKNFDIYILDPIIEPEFEFQKLDFCTNRTDLSNLYNNLDILIFPSVAETFPLTTIEAMACGVCVIANDIGGIPEQITNGINGFLVKDSDYEKMSEILFDLIEHKGIQYIRKIGEAASDHATKNFDIKFTFSKYSELYDSLNSISDIGINNNRFNNYKINTANG